jgi:hypothetical protein
MSHVSTDLVPRLIQVLHVVLSGLYELLYRSLYGLFFSDICIPVCPYTFCESVCHSYRSARPFAVSCRFSVRNASNLLHRRHPSPLCRHTLHRLRSCLAHPAHIGLLV